MEAVRIIKEMREATNGKYPTFALWENVPGAFSSNKGEDFRIVLEELVKVSEPCAVMPAVPPKGWAYADSYVGDGWSLAYRVFDTQYWPRTPQRRRRIHLVADFRGQRARSVLFEREGLCRNFTPGGEAGQDNPANTQGSPGAEGGERTATATYIIDQIGGQGEYYQESTVSSTLRAGGQAAISYTVGLNGDTSVSGTLIASLANAAAGTTQDQLVVAMEVPDDEPAKAYGISSYDSNAMRSSNPRSGIYEADTSRTLDLNGGNPACNQGGIAIVESTRSSQYIVRRFTPTECARLQGFADRWGDIEPKDNLTGEEYRFWHEVRNTHAAINGRKVRDYTEKQMLAWYNRLHTDSAEYKMWGNGIALPPALYCMQGMAEVLKKGDAKL